MQTWSRRSSSGVKSAPVVSTGWIVSRHRGPYSRCCGRYNCLPEEGDTVFKHEKLNSYLYYHSDDNRWVISNVVGASRCWMFAPAPKTKGESAMVIKGWVYLDPESRKWKKDEKMAIESWTRLHFHKPKPISNHRKSNSIPASFHELLASPASKQDAFEHQGKQRTLSRMEYKLKTLIEENKTLMQELEDADILKPQMQQNLDKQVKDLKAENKFILAQAEALKLHVSGLSDSLRILLEELNHTRDTKTSQPSNTTLLNQPKLTDTVTLVTGDHKGTEPSLEATGTGAKEPACSTSSNIGLDML
ncbi:hypothetical protein AAMO2058_001533400 [Amorphochlora amoebiformis]